jgi:cysteine synthase
MKRITGLDEEYIPKILDRSVIDDTIQIGDKDAYQTAIDLARKEGIPVGPTTGAILYAALNYAKADKGIAVVVSPDDAFKYTSFYKGIVDADLAAERQFGLGDGI